jgi:hypothetical protein
MGALPYVDFGGTPSTKQKEWIEPGKEPSVKYLCIAFQDPERLAAYSDDEFSQIMERVGYYLEELRSHGNYLDASRLQPATDGAVVRVRGGSTSVTDGPFVETREQIAGYYLIEANDLNDAIRIAARSPSAHLGTVEVRPLKELGPR